MAEQDEALLALLRADETPAADTIRPRQDVGPASLSFAQQRLWFLHRYTLSAPEWRSAGDDAPPATGTEVRLAAIWKVPGVTADVRAQSDTDGEALMFMDGLRAVCEQGAPAHGEGLPG